MELRHVDPRTLIPNPNNPRNKKPDPAYTAQLAANITAIGLIQPPTVREHDGLLVIKAGDCRTRAAVALKLETIPVLVLDGDDTADSMRSVSENLVRQNLNTVDTWRAMEALAGDGWTDDAIATALAVLPRTIRRLRLCGSIHPAILDQMAKGDEPNEQQLRTIASADRADQEQVWKKHKPKKGEPHAIWWEIARALTRTRFYARSAKFDDKLAEAYGIVWQEDLFEQGDQDNRFTTNGEGFLGAQHEHMTKHLPKNHIILTVDEYGHGKLPPKAQQVYGNPGKGDKTGHYIDEISGEHKIVAYRMPPEKPAKGKAGNSGAGANDRPDEVTKTRPPVTKDGLKMIGDFRTDALHEALATVDLDENTLIGLLILAFAGGNVEVRSGLADNDRPHEARKAIASTIVQNGIMTYDPETLHKAAREMLRYSLTLRERGWNDGSGTVALIAGNTIGANKFLPTMATQEFMSCLSKAEMERVGSANGILPRQTGKATRAAVIERFKDEPFTYEDARFTVPENALAASKHAWDDDNAAEGDEPADSLRDPDQTGETGDHETDPEPATGDDTGREETISEDAPAFAAAAE